MDAAWESYLKASHKYYNWLASTYHSGARDEPQADPSWSYKCDFPVSILQDEQGYWQGCFLSMHGFGSWSRQETWWITYIKHEWHLLRLVPESEPKYKDIRFATTCPNLDVFLKSTCNVIHPWWVLVWDVGAVAWGPSRHLCLVQRSNWRKQISLRLDYCMHFFRNPQDWHTTFQGKSWTNCLWSYRRVRCSNDRELDLLLTERWWDKELNDSAEDAGQYREEGVGYAGCHSRHHDPSQSIKWT